MDHSKIVTVDTEVYVNYALVMFRKITTGDIIYFEKFNDSEIDRRSILHVLNKYTVVTFNGNKFDSMILEAIVAGYKNAGIKKICDMIIVDKKQPWQVRKEVGLAALKMDHIDLIEVAPLQAGLKIYAGRLHAPRLKDLPIKPDAVIQEEDLPVMREYCGIDNLDTELVFKQLEQEIDLRASMSEQYGVDVRSKSDAQIAESVVKKELDERFNMRPKRPKIDTGTRFIFRPPANLHFETEVLQDVYRQFTTLPFTVGKSGHIEFVFENGKKKHQFTIGTSKYTVGTGGLHSCEKSKRHVAGEYIIRDYDVASYYPNIILNNRLYPKHLGEPFLEVYRTIVDRRLKAKALQKKAKEAGDKKEQTKQYAINESLKITINGSFGKLGSKWSILYAPDLMMHVTVIGQLSLLMLIERLELAGISVVSANTDGIVTKFLPEQESEVESITEEWMFDTDYELEGSDYISLNSRDVNNYIAIKKDGVKAKGAYADQRDRFYQLRSNPSNYICSEAAKLFLKDGIPVEETVHSCRDITKFLTLRTVNVGAVKDGKTIGKAIRWYYGDMELDAIFYSTNGNKVPKSDGGIPLLDLPEKFPADVDFEWYVTEAKRIIKDVGYK